MLDSQGARRPKTRQFSWISIGDVKQWSTRAGGRRRHPSGAAARLRCAGADGAIGAIGAMVADSHPAAVPAQFDFCHPSDRNRRTGSANAQLAAGNGCRCADRLRSEPASGRAHRISDAANHLNQAISVHFTLPGGRRKGQRCGGSSGDGGELLPGCGSGEATSGEGALGSTWDDGTSADVAWGGVTSECVAPGGLTSGALTSACGTPGGLTSGALTSACGTPGGLTSGGTTSECVALGGLTSGAVTLMGVSSGGATSGGLTSECRIFGCW